jgi:hypothetical protein
MTCDDEKCDLDDELPHYSLKSFVASDLSGEHDEGVSAVINRAVELRAQLGFARASVIRVRRSA